MIAKLSEAGIRAFKILKQPTPEVESGTVYARPSTPYFVDTNKETPREVQVVVYCLFRYGSVYGDSDHWDIRELCAVPVISFYEALEKLEPGEEITIHSDGSIINVNSAWGADCENPHDELSSRKVKIKFTLGITEDLKTVTLKIFLLEPEGEKLYTDLQQSDNEYESN
jgi:TusA-related sulfurtransferase